MKTIYKTIITGAVLGLGMVFLNCLRESKKKIQEEKQKENREQKEKANQSAGTDILCSEPSGAR